MAAVRHKIDNRYSVLIEKQVSARETVFDWYLYDSERTFAVEIGSASSYHDAVAQAKEVTRRQPNPGRPPKKWFRRCVAGVSAHIADDPNAVCGSLWYNKMSPAQKRKAMREENPTGCASCATALQPNPSTGTTLLLVAAGAIGLWFLFKKEEKPKVISSGRPFEPVTPSSPPRQTFTTAGYNPSFVLGAF